jgi:hypothetical protein
MSPFARGTFSRSRDRAQQSSEAAGDCDFPGLSWIGNLRSSNEAGGENEISPAGDLHTG